MDTEDILTGLKKMIDSELEKLVAADESLTKVADNIVTFAEQSPRNMFLIHIQNKNATQVGTYDEWNKLGRHVKKGEKGIAVFAPTLTQSVISDDNGNRINEKHIRFKISYVFDIAQTDGELIKQAPAKNTDYVKMFDAIKNISPYQFDFSNDKVGKHNNKISIPLGLTDEEILKSAIIQLAELNVKDYNINNKSLAELQSFTAAYVVVKALGLSTSNMACGADIIKGISTEDLKKCLEHVQNDAYSLIAKIDEQINQLEKTIPSKEPQNLSEKLLNASAQVKKNNEKGEQKNERNYNF